MHPTTYEIVDEREVDKHLEHGLYLLIALGYRDSKPVIVERLNKSLIKKLQAEGFIFLAKTGTIEDGATSSHTQRFGKIAGCADSGERNCPFSTKLFSMREDDPTLSFHIYGFQLGVFKRADYPNTIEVEKIAAEACFKEFGLKPSNPHGAKPSDIGRVKRKKKPTLIHNPFTVYTG